MKKIPLLQDYTFEEIEELYIPFAVHFLDPTYLGAIEEDEAIELEYKRILDLPIYQRAEYNNPNCQGVFSARGIGLEGWGLQPAILLSIALEICEDLDIDGKEYAISVFNNHVLKEALGCKVHELIEMVQNSPCDNIAFEAKFFENKVMLLVDREA